MIYSDELNHIPLRELIYDKLKGEILSGKIVPGERILEGKLAVENDVSRTPIREALRKLEKEGLITIKPRKGAYVSSATKTDFQEILEVYNNMEVMAIRFAVSRVSNEILNKMKAIAGNCRLAIDKDIVEEIIYYDMQFYRLIAEACCNKYLFDMFYKLQESIYRFRYIYYGEYVAVDKINTVHKGIIEMFESGETDIIVLRKWLKAKQKVNEIT